MEPVTLINCFNIPAVREDEFFALWRQVNAYMRTKPGYLGHKLHRALAPDAPFRFVDVAQWASAEHFQAARDEGFRALVSQPAKRNSMRGRKRGAATSTSYCSGRWEPARWASRPTS